MKKSISARECHSESIWLSWGLLLCSLLVLLVGCHKSYSKANDTNGDKDAVPRLANKDHDAGTDLANNGLDAGVDAKNSIQDAEIEKEREARYSNELQDSGVLNRMAIQDLELGGHSDWRVPNIQELISLIRGCDQSECRLSDPDCLDPGCLANCNNKCAPRLGPGHTGCYYDTGIGILECSPVNDIVGVAALSYWTSSYENEAPQSNWYTISFEYGTVELVAFSESTVRCVRGG